MIIITKSKFDSCWVSNCRHLMLRVKPFTHHKTPVPPKCTQKETSYHKQTKKNQQEPCQYLLHDHEAGSTGKKQKIISSLLVFFLTLKKQRGKEINMNNTCSTLKDIPAMRKREINHKRRLQKKRRRAVGEKEDLSCQEIACRLWHRTRECRSRFCLASSGQKPSGSLKSRRLLCRLSRLMWRHSWQPSSVDPGYRRCRRKRNRHGAAVSFPFQTFVFFKRNPNVGPLTARFEFKLLKPLLLCLSTLIYKYLANRGKLLLALLHLDYEISDVFNLNSE